MSAPAFMRQPPQIHITPSKPYPWYGNWSEGARFTGAQLYALKVIGRDAETIEAITVRRESTSTEMWWGIDQAPPVFQFDCPVLGRLPDGRVKIISPAGDRKVVLADGWVRAPRHRENKALPPANSPLQDAA